MKLVENYEPKQVLALSVPGSQPVRLPATIPASAGDIDAGTIMGQRTADGVILPVRRCLLAANAAQAANVLNVGAANINKFKVGDVVAIRVKATGAIQNLGAVTAKGADTITVTNALAEAHTANQSYVYVADGTEAARGIMEYSVLDDSEPQQVSPYVGGAFYENQLIGLDDLAIADLGARRTLGGLLIVPA